MEPDFPSIIELNVGGIRYTTFRKTLTENSETLLGKLFTGHGKISRDSKGRFFLDRDGILFRHILNYLRDCEAILPNKCDDLKRLKIEADYFKIPDLIKCIEDKLAEITPSVSTNEKSPYFTMSYNQTFDLPNALKGEGSERSPYKVSFDGKMEIR